MGTSTLPLRPYRHPIWLVAILVAVGFIVALLGRVVIEATVNGIADLPSHYSIPPTFGGSHLFYGLVLSLMMTADGLAFGAVIDNSRFLLTNRTGWRDPAKVMVINETILLTAMLFATVPDVLVLLAWGEPAAPAYAVLSKWDRAADGVAAIIFMIYVFRRIRSRPTLLFQLQRDTIPVDLEPTWEQLRPKFMIIVAVTIISFGVAFGK